MKIKARIDRMVNTGNVKAIVIAATQPEEEIVLRVAAYCRVSTDSDDQINSFTAQNNHYTEMISAHDRWELVDIYADAAVIIGLKTIRLKKFQKHGAF